MSKVLKLKVRKVLKPIPRFVVVVGKKFCAPLKNFVPHYEEDSS